MQIGGRNLKKIWVPSGQTLGDLGWNDPKAPWYNWRYHYFWGIYFWCYANKTFPFLAFIHHLGSNAENILVFLFCCYFTIPSELLPLKKYCRGWTILIKFPRFDMNIAIKVNIETF